MTLPPATPPGGIFLPRENQGQRQCPAVREGSRSSAKCQLHILEGRLWGWWGCVLLEHGLKLDKSGL